MKSAHNKNPINILSSINLKSKKSISAYAGLISGTKGKRIMTEWKNLRALG